MNPETWGEQKQRLECMARGGSTWDLSPRDCQAIKAALAKAELWEKIEKYFSPILLFSSGKFTDSFWEFSKRIPAEIDESIEDAVRRLP